MEGQKEILRKREKERERAKTQMPDEEESEEREIWTVGVNSCGGQTPRQQSSTELNLMWIQIRKTN